MNLKIVTADTQSDLMDINSKFARMVWPVFMLHDAVASEYFDEMYYLFPRFQFALVENKTEKIIAMGNSIPFFWDDDIMNLPDEGWDWVMKKGVSDYHKGIAPNMLSAIQIMVHSEHKGQALSYQAVKVMIELARKEKFTNLVAPVRPNQKSQYPLTSMENYIRWQNEQGLPFDAWLRVHARLNAEIVKVCSQAMLIEGTITEWEEWTKMKFPESGEYIVPGALVPVDINIASNRGTYIEPNVWMNHTI